MYYKNTVNSRSISTLYLFLWYTYNGKIIKRDDIMLSDQKKLNGSSNNTLVMNKR